MSVRLLTLSAASALVLVACSTTQENPNYKYSTKYKASTPYTTTSGATTQNASYIGTTTTSYPSSQHQTVSTQTGYTTVDDQCLRSEKRRELVGGAIGGAAGAYAGKELIGGTKGLVAGGVLGAAAGYGIGDKTINCDPISVPASQYSTVSTQPYQTQTYQAPSQTVQTQYAQPQYAQPQYVTRANTGQVPVQPQPQQVYTAPTDQAYGDTVGTPGYHAMMAAQGSVQPNAVQSAPQQQLYAQQPQVQYVAPQQQLYVQPQQQIYVPTQVSTPQATYGTPGMMTHQITEGDTVYSMAKQLCLDVEDIRRVNNLDANFTIKLGQYIQLPAARCQ